MAESSFKKPIGSEISDLFTELKKDLNSELNLYFDKKKKWVISELDPNFQIKTSTTLKEILKFQLDHDIKISESCRTIWNPIYKKEFLSSNSQYLVVLINLQNLIQNLEQDINAEMKLYYPESTKKIKKNIQKKIRGLLKLINTAEGRAFYYTEKRQSLSNSHKTKLDVLWFYNEKYYTVNPLANTEYTTDVVFDADYPFIGINITQWTNFESASRFVPLLENCLNLFQDQKPLNNSNTYSIEKINSKSNRCSLVFKDPGTCEFFFYVVNKLPIKSVSTYSHYLNVFEEFGFINKKRFKPEHYFNFLKNEFKEERSLRLRDGLTNKNHSRLIQDIRKLVTDFVNETSIDYGALINN